MTAIGKIIVQRNHFNQVFMLSYNLSIHRSKIIVKVEMNKASGKEIKEKVVIEK